jgi:hypothetical protein
MNDVGSLDVRKVEQQYRLGCVHDIHDAMAKPNLTWRHWIDAGLIVTGTGIIAKGLNRAIP